MWAYENNVIFKLDTYCARSGIRNSSIILHPAMVRAFLMSIGTIKYCSDVSHAVDANSGAFEDGAGKSRKVQSFTGHHLTYIY